MWTHMGLGRRPVDAWSCGHSQGTGGTREQPGTDPLWGPADTWTSDPSPQNGQMRHFHCLRPPSVVVCVAVKLAHPQGTGESLTMNPEVPRHRNPERAHATGTQRGPSCHRDPDRDPSHRDPERVHAHRDPEVQGDWCQETLVHTFLLQGGAGAQGTAFQMETHKLQTSREASRTLFMY